MEIKMKRSTDNLKNYYVVTVKTYNGYTNDFSFKHNDDNDLQELREFIIACEVMKKHFPNGGHRRGYDECHYYQKFFTESLPCDDFGYEDCFASYSVQYYDENSIVYDCEITLDNDMIKEIENAKILK